MSREFKRALAAIALWSWVVVVLCVCYAIDPWRLMSVQFFTGMLGLLLPVFIIVAIVFPDDMP